MNYAKIKHFDIANGEGVRMSLFVSGCKFECEGCFNAEAWDFNYGNQYTDAIHDELINLVSSENIAGISLLGGDPFWQDDEGTSDLIKLVRDVKSIGKTVWAWTGFKYDYLIECGTDLQKELLSSVDVLVDGRFEIEKRDIRLKWCGSTNQRVIDIPMSMKEGRVVIHE